MLPVTHNNYKPLEYNLEIKSLYSKNQPILNDLHNQFLHTYTSTSMSCKQLHLGTSVSLWPNDEK